jgi:hypothetical protein
VWRSLLVPGLRASRRPYAMQKRYGLSRAGKVKRRCCGLRLGDFGVSVCIAHALRPRQITPALPHAATTPTAGSFPACFRTPAPDTPDTLR